MRKCNIIVDMLYDVDIENSKCADCGDELPEWAVINKGILICLECSGIHRSLGLHISKVRSCKLDYWEPELTQIMMSLGNSKINSIFEANLDRTKYQKPLLDREKFIKLKHEQKMFMTTADPRASLNEVNVPNKNSKHNSFCYYQLKTMK